MTSQHIWRAFLLSAVLVLSACTPRPAWERADADAHQHSYDTGYCQTAADMELDYLSNLDGHLSGIIMMETFENCMRERGYHPESRG